MDVLNSFKTKICGKGEILLFKGAISKYVFYVVKGCLKHYFIDKKGKEHILQFAPEDWLVTDIESFTFGHPAATFIEAVEDTELILITKDYLDNTDRLNKVDLLKQNGKLIKNIVAANRRLASILGSSAGERYAEFTSTYPSLVKRLPLKHIASYIGVTPEYLSEIRRKIAKSGRSIS